MRPLFIGVLIKGKAQAVRDLSRAILVIGQVTRVELGTECYEGVAWKALIRVLERKLIGKLPESLSRCMTHSLCPNLRRCLAMPNLNCAIDEIKIDKTLHFVEESVEIIDREVKSLKRSKIPIVKVRWNSKCGPEFTWEREDHMKAKYP
ncbi:hypothetical protein Tco_0887714 [Tanacetum coccineum]